MQIKHNAGSTKNFLKEINIKKQSGACFWHHPPLSLSSLKYEQRVWTVTFKDSNVNSC